MPKTLSLNIELAGCPTVCEHCWAQGKPYKPMPLEDIEVVVTPGLAFDRKGNRLGRGGAYYDRFLASPGLNATICSLAFAEQMVDEVPVDAHDRAVDFLVTDEGIIKCV